MKILKRFLQIILVFLVFLLLVVPVQAASTTTGNATYNEEQKLDKMDVGYGVSYHRSVGKTSATIRSGTYNQTVHYLNTVCNDTIRVVPWTKFVNNKWKLTSVRNLMADFEAKNPGWIVLAGVNADFFDINALNPLPYQPNNAQVFEGNIYKTSGKSYNRTIGITNDGAIDSLIMRAVPPTRAYMTLEVLDENEQVIVSFDVEKINAAPDNNQTAVFFGTYNSSHTYDARTMPSVAGASIYYVEEADLALPNSETDFYGKGTITSSSAFSIAVGQFAIASKNQNVENALAIGTKIRVQRHFTGEFADLKYVIGGGTAVLVDGEAPSDVNTAASVMGTNHPRTAIGRKADGSIVLSVVDGRIDDNVSRGVYGDELAAIMKHAGCVEA
ncbi:MAG: phosphodiester glycosidase family protein, partial [Bacilli bacterium]|nr:phosphodiester glycosidase family protein [Bacilli bacterium]